LLLVFAALLFGFLPFLCFSALYQLVCTYQQFSNRHFLMQSSDGAEEVLVLSPADVDVSVHEGLLVRVEGTLDLSTSSAAMLLMSTSRPVEEAVLPCHQQAQPRKLHSSGSDATGSTTWSSVCEPSHCICVPIHIPRRANSYFIGVRVVRHTRLLVAVSL
jgi:hypothetical protein